MSLSSTVGRLVGHGTHGSKGVGEGPPIHWDPIFGDIFESKKWQGWRLAWWLLSCLGSWAPGQRERLACHRLPSPGGGVAMTMAMLSTLGHKSTFTLYVREQTQRGSVSCPKSHSQKGQN